MVAIAKSLGRALTNRFDVELLKSLAISCGAGLAVSLLLAGYGLDFGPF